MIAISYLGNRLMHKLITIRGQFSKQ